MTQIAFTIPGRLRGKQRPKFARIGKFVRTYTPAETQNAEAQIKTIAYAAMAGRAPMEGPLVLTVEVFLNHPDSWSGKRKRETLYVTGKPDPDNSIKLFCDSVNGIIWKDDSQIAVLNFRRTYDDTQAEHVTISVFAPGTALDDGWVVRRDLAKAAMPRDALKVTPLFGEVAG